MEIRAVAPPTAAPSTPTPQPVPLPGPASATETPAVPPPAEAATDTAVAMPPIADGPKVVKIRAELRFDESLNRVVGRIVDEETGDRRSPCTQPMKPIGIAIRDDGEWSLIHRCTGCHTLRTNRIAGDDHECRSCPSPSGLSPKPRSRLMI